MQPDEINQLVNTARIDDVSVEMFTSAEDREAILEHRVAGNVAQMDDPAFVRELRDSIRFNAAEALHTRDGLFSACSGNSTMPSWLGRRLFSMFYPKDAENDKYASQLRMSVRVVVFAGDRTDIAGWIDVGRSFQRFVLNRRRWAFGTPISTNRSKCRRSAGISPSGLALATPDPICSSVSAMRHRCRCACRTV